ncbi:hypothetical protein PENVUL_c069G06653 [Penicillium vulpinum]|uniref:Uncharacterized protein n=1 Tax=Penicillium vulpinum TaxID=29845 RepID=A0A1V6RBU5_9EURO|nr:hypothetical protein PENVUL_c069G06653 [Penicillium vulpinum]
MYIPIELLSRILEETLEICLLQDLWKLRLVNFFFARKVEAFLMERVELENYGSPTTQVATRSKVQWNDLPYRMKRLYLYCKLQIHDYSQCSWSILVREIIDLPNQRTTNETATLINNLIDAYLCGRFDDCRKLLDPVSNTEDGKLIFARPSDGFYTPFESFETTLQCALATSAIQRGDCARLQAILGQGGKITIWSNRLGILPLDIAAKKGSGAIIELLLANGCPMRYEFYRRGEWHRYDYVEVLDTMAENGNDQGLDVLIGHMAKEGEMCSGILKRMMTRAVGGGHISVMKLVQQKCETMYGSPGWDPQMLGHAIDYGSLTAIKYLFHRGEVDVNTRASPIDRSPLLRSVYRTPISRRPEIVSFLLENGADSNGTELPKKKTPLEVAVKAKDYESASILLKHGAVANSRWMMSLLLDNSKPICAALAQLLWPSGGSYEKYKAGGKSYMLCRDAKKISNIENAFIDLGWDEQYVKEVEFTHFIDLYS